MVKAGDAQAVAIFEEYNGSVMTSFPQLSNEDIDNILAYTDYTPPAPVAVAQPAATAAQVEGGFTNDLILGVLLLVLAVLVVMLFLVTKSLKQIAAANGIEVFREEKPKRTPLWKAYAQNPFLVFVTVVFLLLSSAYVGYSYLMQVGIDQGYMPIQPIHYSHKIHSGDNQIECKYCHSSARVSKHSGIPSLNVCVNCHMNIAEYNGEED